MLCKALGTKRKDVVVASKVFGRIGSGPNDVGLSRAHISRAIEDSLQRLGTDFIDLHQIHGFDPLTPMEETLSAFTDLVKQAKVRYIGCSNLAAWHHESAGNFGPRAFEKFVTLQAYYSPPGAIERESCCAADRRSGCWCGVSRGGFCRAPRGAEFRRRFAAQQIRASAGQSGKPTTLLTR
jgi:aryl-alcohol dehydrogenase-like predicted oxidoreductase